MGALVKVFGLALAIGAALLAFAMPASAATLGVSYSGVLNYVPPAGAGQFTVGDTFTFNIVVDDSVPDDEPMAGVGRYSAIKQFNGSFSNGYTFASTTGTDRVRTIDDPLGDVAEFQGFDLTAPAIGDYALNFVSLLFNDPSGSMLGSEAIPTDLAGLLSLSLNNTLMLQFLTPGGNAFIALGAATSTFALSL